MNNAPTSVPISIGSSPFFGSRVIRSRRSRRTTRSSSPLDIGRGLAESVPEEASFLSDSPRFRSRILLTPRYPDSISKSRKLPSRRSDGFPFCLTATSRPLSLGLRPSPLRSFDRLLARVSSFFEETVSPWIDEGERSSVPNEIDDDPSPWPLSPEPARTFSPLGTF